MSTIIYEEFHPMPTSIYTRVVDRIIAGDSLEVLKGVPDHSVDLIVTSPPYADRRAKTYEGVKPDKYVEWFLPISDELKRVLKPTGSFVLNIKEIVVDGERSTYVMEIILAMRKRGWLWTEEYSWHKKNCYPGKWPNRFRDAWERCLHFTRQKKFAMYQEAVMVPMGDWRHARLKNLSETDRTRDNSHVSSGFGKNISNWVGRDMAYPSNVLHMATECGNKNHSATFPVALPAWFIQLFTKPGDVVLDPFVGSGTTAVAAKELKRHYIGIDISSDFCEIARKRVQSAERVDIGKVHSKRRQTRNTDTEMPLFVLSAANSGD
jgi:site-specific DNA-methyltransferase (adenine-specific)